MQNKINVYCEKIIEGSWLTAVILTPLFFNIYSSRIFEPDKIAIFRSLALVIVAAWFILIVLNSRRIGVSKFRNIRTWVKNHLNPFTVVIGLMVVSYVLSTLLSVNPWISWFGSYQRSQGTYTFLSYMVFFLAIVIHLRHRDQLDRLLNVIVMASIPVALYGVLQHFNLDPIPWGKDTSIRVASSLGNSIFIAAYLIMVFPISLWRILNVFKMSVNGQNKLLNILRFVFYGFINVLFLTALLVLLEPQISKQMLLR